MANYTGAVSSADQIKDNYEKYKNKFKDSTNELVNSETFMNLMIAEMTNQDPLEPTSNTEFVSQLAQFTQLTYAQDSSKYAMANYAATLVGKIATGSKMDGTELVAKTGVVESVTQSGNTYLVRIDGTDFDIKKITAVKDSGSNTSGGTSGVTSSALGDSISRAAMMVGMYATVDLGNNITKTGFIDSIKVKDGKISVMITDVEHLASTEHPIESIIELTEAYFIEEPNGTEDSDGGNTEDGKDDNASDKVPETEE